MLKPNNKNVDNFSKLSELQRRTLWACKMLILMSDENGRPIFFISVENRDTIYLTQLYCLTLLNNFLHRVRLKETEGV